MRPRLKLTAALLSVFIAAGSGGVRVLQAQGGKDADAAKLRTLFFQRDYETALIEAAKMMGTGANAASIAVKRPELNAWYILNLVRRGQEKDAVDAARAMVAAAPASGWSYLALAGALNYQAEQIADAVEAGNKALKLMPGDADAIWVHALTLSSDAKTRDEAIAFVDGQRSNVAKPAQLLAVKAYSLYVQSTGRTPDTAKLQAALDTFEEARKLDPANLDAHYAPGTYLTSLRRGDEAIPLLKKAVAIAPGSTPVHQAYWRAINSSQTLTADAKTAEVQADITSFLDKAGSRPGPLYAASSMAGDMKNTARQRELEDVILQKFPDGVEGEWILAYRWRERTPDGKENPEYRKTLEKFLARRKHYIEGLLGEAYRNMFFILVEDKATTAEDLKPVLDGMVTYETTNVHIVYSVALVSLADHKLLLSDAERLARASMDVLKKKVESQRDAYAGAGEYERGMNYMVSMGHDALGWVLYAERKDAEAEKELLASYEMNHESRVNLHHLGKFYEAKDDIARAEEYYVKGLAVSALGENPCETALKALYARKNGGADGFDTYLADLRDRDRVHRKDVVLKDRATTPAAAPAFNLKTLDGTRVSLESLKGKVVAINFWGIWCGWCVHELPDYQKLYEKYKDDKDVVILTIDNDQNPDDVPPWMKQKKYTFPVLLDDGFVAKSGLNTFPTTWFLDREGRQAFVKVGWSEKLLEEFSWRIEAIK